MDQLTTCPRCANRLPAFARFCSRCGVAVSAVRPGPFAPAGRAWAAPAVRPTPSVPRRGRKSILRRTWVVWVGVFFMFKAGFVTSTAHHPRVAPSPPPVIIPDPSRWHTAPSATGKVIDRRGARRQSPPPPVTVDDDRW